MTRDFTLEKYSELVQALKDNYRIMTVADYLALPKGEEFWPPGTGQSRVPFSEEEGGGNGRDGSSPSSPFSGRGAGVTAMVPEAPGIRMRWPT